MSSEISTRIPARLYKNPNAVLSFWNDFYFFSGGRMEWFCGKLQLLVIKLK